METERMGLSQRERDRLKVPHEVQQGHLTQVEAGRQMQLSDRQITNRTFEFHFSSFVGAN